MHLRGSKGQDYKHSPLLLRRRRMRACSASPGCVPASLLLFGVTKGCPRLPGRPLSIPERVRRKKGTPIASCSHVCMYTRISEVLARWQPNCYPSPLNEDTTIDACVWFVYTFALSSGSEPVSGAPRDGCARHINRSNHTAVLSYCRHLNLLLTAVFRATYSRSLSPTGFPNKRVRSAFVC